MHHNETVSAVARKLYHFSKKDVALVLEVLTEVWQETLLDPDGVIHLKGLGRLRIEEQVVKTSPAVRQLLVAKRKRVPATMKRYYFRFSASQAFKQQVIASRQPQDIDRIEKEHHHE